jgi:putative ABC transport system substrate-binding protein
VKRREFITLLGGAAVAWPFAMRAQQAERIWRIGWLTTGDPASYRFSLAAFRDGLRALGYVEGRNVTIEYKWAEGDPARLPNLADELVRQNVDVIVAGGSIGAQAAKNATSLIPIVAAGTADLVELGLVTALPRPGGNLTGFVSSAPESAGKRIQMMKEMLPQARRAAVLWNPNSSSAEFERRAVNASGAAIEVALTF